MKKYADHPVKRYLSAGVVVTVNTDNRLMSQTDLTREFEEITKALKLTRERRASTGLQRGSRRLRLG